MSCYFCDKGLRLLPEYTGEQYHEYDPEVAGYPRCAFAFESKSSRHPFIPRVVGDACGFCGSPREDAVHDIGGTK